MEEEDEEKREEKKSRVACPGGGCDPFYMKSAKEMNIDMGLLSPAAFVDPSCTEKATRLGSVSRFRFKGVPPRVKSGPGGPGSDFKGRLGSH